MQPTTVWITGAGGLIGSWLCRSAPAGVGRVVGLLRQDVDLTDFEAVRQRFERERPDTLFHCAAMSRSPACEADPARARLVNVDATAFLAELFSKARMVFFSTDLVFDGQRGGYVESDRVGPLGVYARTKVEAEGAVLAHANHIVVRTSLNGGGSPTGDRGFNEQMLAAWRAGKALKLFYDEFRSPIAAEVTAKAAWEIAMKGAPGVYHVAGAERMSRLRLGELLAARHPELEAAIEPSSLKSYQGPPRPPDTSLDCGKAQALLSFPLPRFSDWLEQQPRGSF